MASQRNYNTFGSFVIAVYDELNEHPETQLIKIVALRLDIYRQFDHWLSRQRNPLLVDEVTFVIETWKSNMGNCSLGCLVHTFISLVGQEKSAKRLKN